MIQKHLAYFDALSLIRQGSVWVKEKRISDANRKILAGETVSVYVSPYSGKIPQWDSSLCVFESDDFLVVYKKAGLAVAPTRDSLVNNLTAAVNRYLNQDYSVIALTRLDRAVRGLVIFPKNAQSHREFSFLLREHRIMKSYFALVEKKTDFHSGVIEDPLSFRKKAFLDPKGKPSRTRFRKIADCSQGTLLRIHLFTGRRHQIRAHLANRVAPVLGDRLYGSRIKFRGIALMAESYRFYFRGKFYHIKVPDNCFTI